MVQRYTVRVLQPEDSAPALPVFGALLGSLLQHCEEKASEDEEEKRREAKSGTTR